MAWLEFTRPDTKSEEYGRLWAVLDRKQKRHLVNYNRICVDALDGRLYVIPYSRFHDQRLGGEERGKFYHCSTQQWIKRKGIWRYEKLRCGGVGRTHAALNVLGIKLLLETDPDAFTSRSRALDWQFNGKMKQSMTLRESYRVALDSIPMLGEVYISDTY